jgi:hypothetical protein
VIGRLPIRAEDDEVLEVRAVEFDRAVNQIGDPDGSRGHAEAYRAWPPLALPGGNLRGRKRRAGAVVEPAASCCLRRFTFGLQFRDSAVAVVGVTAGHQPLGQRPVAVDPFGLIVRSAGSTDDRPLVPVQAEPPHAVEDAVHHLGGGPLRVGVFDAEHEDAAAPAGQEPVEQGGAGAADVEVAGR